MNRKRQQHGRYSPTNKFIIISVVVLCINQCLAFVSPARNSHLEQHKQHRSFQIHESSSLRKEEEEVCVQDSLSSTQDVVSDIIRSSDDITRNIQTTGSETDDGSSDDDFEFPYTIICLCWLVTFLSALDRVAMSVAMLPLSTELALSESAMGQISAGISIGYGLGILPIGILLSIASPRIVMGCGILLWSLATLATPWSATLLPILESQQYFLWPLLLMRASVGAAESVVLPTMQRIVSAWITYPDRISGTIALVLSGFPAGTTAAYLLSPYLMDNFGGWRGLFTLYGSAGLLLLAPWLILAKDSPDTKYSQQVLEPSTNSQSNIMSAIQNSFSSAPLQEMISSPGVQATILGHAASNWGLYNVLAWSPTFYAEHYGLNVQDSSWYSILPSVAGAVGGLVAGNAGDAWLRRTTSDNANKTKIRKTFQSVAALGPALCLGYLSQNLYELEAFQAQILLMGTIGLQSFNAAGYGPAAQDKASEKYSGLLYSLTSLPGVMLGSVGVSATGIILEQYHHDWSVVFGGMAIVHVLGGIGFVTLYDSTREFD